MGVIKEIQEDLEAGARRLFGEYHSKLLAEARSLCSDSDSAEDLVMLTLETYFAKPEKYDSSKGELMTWLKAVMRNHFRKSLRRKSHIDTIFLPADDLQVVAERLQAGEARPEPEGTESDELIRRAVASLSPKVRDAVILHYFKGQPVDKTASALGISVEAAKNRLFCARQILHARLKGRLGKSLAVLAALLFGVTALFGAFQLAKVEERGSGLLTASEKESEPSASATPVAGADVLVGQESEANGFSVVESILTNEQKGTNEMKIADSVHEMAKGLFAVAAATGLSLGAGEAHAEDDVSPRVSIVSIDRVQKKARLSFEGIRETMKVYGVFGDRDLGENLDDWPQGQRVDLGEIAAGATVAEFDLDDNDPWTRRFFICKELADDGYDLTYLESNGSQFIDTKYIGKWGDKWDIDFSFTKFTDCHIASSYATAGMDANNGTRYTVCQFNADKQFVAVINGNAGSVIRLSPAVQVGKDYHLSVDFKKASQSISVAGESGTGTYSGEIGNGDSSVYLFARHAPNVAGTFDKGASIRLKACKLTNDGETVFDLRPCLLGGEAGLLDVVNNEFYKAGAGTFAYDETTMVRRKCSSEPWIAAVEIVSTDLQNNEVTLSHPPISEAMELFAYYSRTSAHIDVKDVSTWDKAEKLADVAAGSTGGTYSVPEFAGGDGDYIAMTYVLCFKQLPTKIKRYAAWLVGDGEACIDTGYIGKINDVWDFVARFNVAEPGNCFLAGADPTSGSGSTRYTPCQYNASHQFVAVINGATASTVTKQMAKDREFTVRSELKSGAQTMTVDGASGSTVNGGASVNNTTRSVYLFARNGSNGREGVANASMSSVRCTNGEDTILDLVPAVGLNDEAGFYDIEHDVFLGNAGSSGSFSVVEGECGREGEFKLFIQGCSADYAAPSEFVRIVLTDMTETLKDDQVKVGWSVITVGDPVDIYAVCTTDGVTVRKLVAENVTTGTGTSVLSGMYAANCSLSLEAKNSSGDVVAESVDTFVYDLFPTANVISTSADGLSVSGKDAATFLLSVRLTTVAPGRTVLRAQYGATSDLGREAVLAEFDNDGTMKSYEVAVPLSMNLVDSSGQVWVKVLAENSVPNAVGGTLVRESSTAAVERDAVSPNLAFTWVADAQGGLDGEWTDESHWKHEGFAVTHYPCRADQIAVFPSGTVARVAMPAALEIGEFDFRGEKTRLTFVPVSGVSSSKVSFVRFSGAKVVPGISGYDNDGGEIGADSQIVFRDIGLKTAKSDGTSTLFMGERSVLRLLGASNSKVSSCRLMAISGGNDLPFASGAFDFGEGVTFGLSGNDLSSQLILACGDGGVVRIGGQVAVTDVTYGYFSGGGGAVEIYGIDPCFKVSKSFRSKWVAANTKDSELRFVVPSECWIGRKSACVEHAGVLGATDEDVAKNAKGLSTKLRVCVSNDSPGLMSTSRKADGEMLLVRAAGGINTNRVELVRPKKASCALYYTWGNDPQATSGEGLPTCIWLHNEHSKLGLILMIR